MTAVHDLHCRTDALLNHMQAAEHRDQFNKSPEEKRCVFKAGRRYSKAEESMHEDDAVPDQQHPERRFSAIEAPTVVTTPFIFGHSVETAPEQLHLLSSLRKEEEDMVTRMEQEPKFQNKARRPSVEMSGRRASFGDGGYGDHSAKHWDWPLGERGQVEVLSEEKHLEVLLDFRPFQPNEVWAKVMGDELIIHCKSSGAHTKEVFRNYALPLNCDPRTARFRIKDGHSLVVKLDKELPIKLAVASFTAEELQKHKTTVHAEYSPSKK